MDTQTTSTPSKKCTHETAESLGLDSNMTFLRCVTCGTVLVSEGGRMIAIPPVLVAGPRDA